MYLISVFDVDQYFLQILEVNSKPLSLRIALMLLTSLWYNSSSQLYFSPWEHSLGINGHNV